jgi:hypothetical protein
VLPSLATEYKANGSTCYFVFSGELVSRYSLLVAFANVANCLLGQHRLGVLLASGVRWINCSSLCPTVTYIVDLSSKKQMVRIHARWVVTGVQNAKSVRILACSQLKGYAVSRVMSAKRTVVMLIALAHPQPTLVGVTLSDLRPEAGFNGRMGMHGKSPLSMPSPDCFNSAGVLPVHYST